MAATTGLTPSLRALRVPRGASQAPPPSGARRGKTPRKSRVGALAIVETDELLESPRKRVKRAVALAGQENDDAVPKLSFASAAVDRSSALSVADTAARALEKERLTLIHDVLGPVDGAAMFYAVRRDPAAYGADKRPFMRRLVAAVRAVARAAPSGWRDADLSEKSIAAERCLQTLAAMCAGNGRLGVCLCTTFAPRSGAQFVCTMEATLLCSLATTTVSGAATSKKLAKRSAAVAVLRWLRERQAEAPPSPPSPPSSRPLRATAAPVVPSAASRSAVQTSSPVLLRSAAALRASSAASPAASPATARGYAAAAAAEAAAAAAERSEARVVAVTLRRMVAGHASDRTFVVHLDAGSHEDEPVDKWAQKKTTARAMAPPRAQRHHHRRSGRGGRGAGASGAAAGRSRKKARGRGSAGGRDRTRSAR